METGLETINWQTPWLAPYVEPGQKLAQQVAAGQSSAEALNSALALYPAPVRFVPQANLPAGMAYESYIFDSGLCPTREGLHDFFNGIAWLTFPQSRQVNFSRTVSITLKQLRVCSPASFGIALVTGS